MFNKQENANDFHIMTSQSGKACLLTVPWRSISCKSPHSEEYEFSQTLYVNYSHLLAWCFNQFIALLHFKRELWILHIKLLICFLFVVFQARVHETWKVLWSKFTGEFFPKTKDRIRISLSLRQSGASYCLLSNFFLLDEKIFKAKRELIRWLSLTRRSRFKWDEENVLQIWAMRCYSFSCGVMPYVLLTTVRLSYEKFSENFQKIHQCLWLLSFIPPSPPPPSHHEDVRNVPWLTMILTYWDGLEVQGASYFSQ